MFSLFKEGSYFRKEVRNLNLELGRSLGSNELKEGIRNGSTY